MNQRLIKFNDSLGLSLLFYVFLVSSLVAVVTTSLQLFFDYKSGITQLNSLATRIKTNYLEELSISVKNGSENQTNALLKGLIALPDITYASIDMDDEVKVSIGKKVNTNGISYQWDLLNTQTNKQSSTGTLSLEISKSRVCTKLKDRIAIVLIINLLNAFLVMFLILFIVRFLIVRYFSNIYTALADITDFDKMKGDIYTEDDRPYKNIFSFGFAPINKLRKKFSKLWGDLLASENNYRYLLTKSRRGILVVSNDEVYFCNHAYLKMFDIQSSNEIDLKLYEQYLFTTDRKNYPDVESLEKAIDETAPKELSLCLKTKDNKTKFVNGLATNAMWYQKPVTFFIFLDFTEKKYLEDTVKQQQTALIQADKMSTLGVMVSGITHELNNPNQAIKINSEIISACWHEITPVLDKYYELNPNMTLQNVPYEEVKPLICDALSDNIASCINIEKIITELKSFIRSDELMEIQIHDINAIIQNTIKITSHHAKKRRVGIEYTENANVPSFECNETLINQAFVNILINAIEACEYNIGQIAIKVSYDDASITVEIKDNGIGIPDDKIEYVFDLFQTSKNNSGGTGIGLAIVYALIEKHNGNIQVKSDINKGTTFFIHLPLKHGSKV